MSIITNIIKKSIIHFMGKSVNISKTPFYKEFPYTGSLKIESIDNRGLVDFDLQIFFNRIPKSANSTVVINIAEQKFGYKIPSLKAKKIFTKPSQIIEEDLNRFMNLFKFTIVRNPYVRTLSAYLDKVVRRKSRIKQLYNKCGNPISFREFCKYLGDGGLYGNIHWAPQESILLIPIDLFDYIGKVEKIGNDLPFIFKQFTKNKYLPSFTSHTPHQTNSKNKIDQYYDNYCEGIIKSLYKKDFDIFEYPTNLPK